MPADKTSPAPAPSYPEQCADAAVFASLAMVYRRTEGRVRCVSRDIERSGPGWAGSARFYANCINRL